MLPLRHLIEQKSLGSCAFVKPLSQAIMNEEEEIKELTAALRLIPVLKPRVIVHVSDRRRGYSSGWRRRLLKFGTIRLGAERSQEGSEG
jgi:hypothetical protein